MPQGIQIGPIMIRYYALLILAGALVAAWISSKEAQRRGKDPEMIWDMLLGCSLAALSGQGFGMC